MLTPKAILARRAISGNRAALLFRRSDKVASKRAVRIYCSIIGRRIIEFAGQGAMRVMKACTANSAFTLALPDASREFDPAQFGVNDPRGIFDRDFHIISDDRKARDIQAP